MIRPTKGYWWECTSCNECNTFKKETGKGSVASFVWDILAPSGWDQSLLTRQCKACNLKSMKITYDFPKKERTIIFVNHIIGRKLEDVNYLPMLWETQPKGSEKIWYDFKYQIKRNNFGLNKPAVMQSVDLSYLLKEFNVQTGKKII
jgi:hypothetical protein